MRRRSFLGVMVAGGMAIAARLVCAPTGNTVEEYPTVCYTFQVVDGGIVVMNRHCTIKVVTR